MSDRQDWDQPQPPQQSYGQQYPQGPWQPQPYDPRQHQHRIGGQRAPWQQATPPAQGQPWPPPGYQPPPQGPPGWQQPGFGQQPPPYGPPGEGGPPREPHDAPQPPRQPKRKPWPVRHKVLSGLIAVGTIAIIAAAASSSNKPSTPAADSTTVASSPASPAAVPSSAAASSAPSTPASLSMTGAQQQAVDAAEGYMQMGGFSQASLIQQLTSSAGNGFTQAQAEYAASQVGL
jgi:hypothetical protein